MLLLEGDFNISAPITLRKRVILEGAGKHATRINAPGDFTAFAFEGHGFRVADMEIIVGRAGQGETILAPALLVDGLRETTFASLRLVRRGIHPGRHRLSSIVLEARGPTDNTVRFEGCDFMLDVESGPTYRVVYTQHTASPTFSRCVIKGSSGARDFNVAVMCSGDSAPAFYDCTILGGDGGEDCFGAWALIRAHPIFHNCFIQGGHGATGACEGVPTSDAAAPVFNSCRIRCGYGPNPNVAAVTCTHGSNPTFSGCIVEWGDEPSRGVGIGRSSSPRFNSCVISPIQHSHVWFYDSANNGRFRPFAGKPYQLVGAQVFVRVLHPDVTVDLGTTPGGSEIAAAVPLARPETMSMAFRRVDVGADGYLYATPSAPVSNGDFAVYYAVVVNYPDSPAVVLAGAGYPLIEGCTVIANGASNALEVFQDSVETMNWRVMRSHLETLDPVNQHAVRAVAPLAQAPFYYCDFVGGLHNVSSLAGPGGPGP